MKVRKTFPEYFSRTLETKTVDFILILNTMYTSPRGRGRRVS
jgi:hypothetical protein